jgi:hypothetical protein
LKGTLELLIYEEDIIMLVGNVYNIRENTEHLLEASTEVGLGVNTERTGIWFCLVTKIQDRITVY